MSFTKDIFNVSTKKQTKESITPHKIAVSILIREFCLYRENVRFQGLSTSLKPVHRRDFAILCLKLIQSPDLMLKELRGLLLSGKYSIDPKFVEKFDSTLKDLYEIGTSCLLDLAEYISRLTVDVHVNGVWCQINKNSIVGCYLRRLMLYFDKLTYSEVVSVFEAYKVYFEPCKSDIKYQEYVSQNFNDSSINERKINLLNDSVEWSRRQAELFIATQASLIANNEELAQSPIELNNHLRNVLKSNPDLAEAHFLSYLNYLRVKEFCGAINSLYHCFDRSTPVADSKNNNVDDKSKGFRFAALNLAVLYAMFNHKEEALAALKESITMAQEANDNVCLQHALTWLYRLTDVDKEFLMERSIQKSLDLNLTYLASLSVQSYTHHVGLSGGNPKQIFEVMTRSDMLNCQYTYRDLMCNSYAQKSSLWLLYGKIDMSLLWCQLLLHLNTDNLTPDKTYNGEGTCQAICNIANILLLEGEYKLSQSILKLARKTFPNEPISHNWMFSECIHSYTKALHNGDWALCFQMAEQMETFDKWESCLRLTELYIQKENELLALETINHVIESQGNTKPAIHFKIQAMVLLAQVHCASSKPGHIPANVMTILNSALSFTSVYHLNYLGAIIHLHLANVQLIIGMPKQALKTLEFCLIQILAHGGAYDRARALLLYVKCLVADASTLCIEERNQVLMEAADMLHRVKDDFVKIEAYSRVTDVLYLQAQLYKTIGHYEFRNQSAYEYRQYLTEHPSKNNSMLVTSV